MVKLVIDAYGGDEGPSAIVKACVDFVNDYKDAFLYITGLEEVNTLLAQYEYDKERIEVIPCTDFITPAEYPTDAIRQKPESTLMKAIKLLKEDETVKGLVSTGSTGAILAAGVLKLGRIRGVKRPALCPLVPTMDGNFVALCDSGANAACDEFYLQQFAQMGNLYLQKAYGIEKPRVALLNVGVEEDKGDDMHRNAYQLLKNTEGLNFVGNMESRDFISGNYDLVVCDGFSGNVLLKSTEGTALELLKLLKKTFTANFKSKMGALLLKGGIYKIKNMMDYANYPGAVLLGTQKLIIKSHGSSKSKATYESIKLAYKLDKADLITSIKETFQVPQEN